MKLPALLLFLTSFQSVASETISFKFIDNQQQALSGVHLYNSDGLLIAKSDQSGSISNITCATSCSYRVALESFEDKQITSSDTEQSITLSQIDNSENVVRVLASRTPKHFDDISVTQSYTSPQDIIGPANTNLDFISKVAGVAENGQGGLFQTYSIRGMSRQRVLTHISDIPIKTERRAGLSSSFLHPMLFAQAEVKKGPGSTLFQSGGLGGVIQFQPAFFDSSQFSTSFANNGNLNQQFFSYGDEDSSFAIGRQHSNQSEDAQGNSLNDGFSQYSTSYIQQWSSSEIEYEFMLLASLGKDIGRSSTRYPERVVAVPTEKHLLTQWAAQADDWRFSLYAHPNKVDTNTLRPAERNNLVKSSSFDWGSHFESNWQNQYIQGIWGLDAFIRSNIRSKEFVEDFVDQTYITQTNLQSSQEVELGAFSTLNYSLGDTKLQLGLRALSNQQSHPEHADQNNNALTGFLGSSSRINNNWLWTANLGTGVRFATVSERFFNGTTGRGTVLGNPDLEEERSVSLDIGLQYSNKSTSFGLNIYQQRIRNYIERIEIAPELLSFDNINKGRIQGLELEARYAFSKDLQAFFSSSYIKGYDQNKQALVDIPSNRFELGADYKLNDWTISVSVEHRLAKSFIASSEQQTAAASIADLGISYQLSDSQLLTLAANNLFDENYYSSQDELVPLAAGRDISISYTIDW